MGNKYKMEVRITGEMFREGDSVPFMVSEGIDPFIVKGDSVEDILEQLGRMNEVISNIHGKDNRESLSVCMPESEDGFSICDN